MLRAGGLAAAGVAGRRECEQLILDGRVEVDRQVVTELGTRVDPRSQEIRVDGESLSRPKLVYFAVNKPDGVVSTSNDPAGRPRVIDLLPPDAPRTFEKVFHRWTRFAKQKPLTATTTKITMRKRSLTLY